MIKNEKEFQHWYRDFLRSKGHYARKLETPFDKGWADIYSIIFGQVMWQELKWMKPVSVKKDRKILIQQVLDLPTALQRQFQEEQQKHGVASVVVTGYYLDDDMLKTRKPNLRFIFEDNPLHKVKPDLTADELLGELLKL